ncbi:chalcone isomerase family protein [Bermanella sp. R86510]|uniref:chalcone isomerase family protein n=1 Tax=unclassified Bermanella TaxID=2627862 RepID=UPI0037CC0A47
MKASALLLTALLMCLGSLSYSKTVAGVDVPDLVPATSEHPELTLNGASLRELYLMIDTYVGALYLETPSRDPEFIMNSEMHKRMVFHVKMRNVSARRIANALQDALVLNITPEQHKALMPRLEQMLSYFDGEMHDGDQSIFDYSPNVGTRVIINGEEKGIIPGEDYFKAMLAIWVGENPVGRQFKRDILGLEKPL